MVTNGSKTSFSLSSGMPGPRSDIASSAKFSTREVRMLIARSSTGRVRHRIDRIDDQVKNDLLKLDAIADNRERGRRNQTGQFDFPSNSQCREKFDCFPHQFVEVDIFRFEGCLFQQAAHPPNDFAGAPVILQNIVHDIVEFLEVGVRRTSIDCAVSAFVRMAPKWLVDFMGN